MKRLLVIFICLLMVMSFCVPTFAEGFVSSPSSNQAPELVEGSNASEECEAIIIITAYADRSEEKSEHFDASLNKEIKDKLEEAYDDITNAPTLGALNSDVNKIAKEMGIKKKDLAVSDLFDISATHCESHDGHKHFDITLKSEALENFVCLLHFHDGEWKIVEGATVTHDGTHLEFDIDEFSPFAIVIESPAEPSYILERLVVATAIITLCIVVAVYCTKKRTAK